MKTEYEEFLEATADLGCARAHEFSNRANARMALGRQDEALRDYDKACNLEPDEPSFLLNRSVLFLELGTRERALEDLGKARQISGNGDVANPRDLFYIARMFLRCNEPNLAEGALLAFLRFVWSIIPHTTANDDVDGYIVRKDGRTVHICPDILNLDDLRHFIHVLSKVKSGKGIAEIKRLLRTIKKGASHISRTVPVR